MSEIAEFTRHLGNYLPPPDIALVERAFVFSDSAHRGQFRKSGEPYITHPLAVASILSQWRLDAQGLAAALLHDVMEDTAITKAEIETSFGKPVADMVDGVSKLDQIEFTSREDAQAESFRKMLLAMAQDIRVILIKLADRLHNMRTLDAMAPIHRKRVARETLDIYAPIANRLGLNALYLELQDLAFKHLNPLRYRILANAIKAARGNRREVMNRLLDVIREGYVKAGIVAVVTGREKTIYSVYKKMREKRYTFSQVFDIYGVRVLVPDKTVCYAALGVLHGLYKPIPGKFKDYIAIPKANGYQSLHTTLFGPFGTPLEAQIRTNDMHRIAEAGVAAHWLYKSGGALDLAEAQRETHRWLQSLLEIQSESRDSKEFLENIKGDLFPEEVYVFTPKGKIMACRAVPRPSISRTPCIPTSAITASPRASTTSSCRCAPSSRTGTTWRSSRRRPPGPIRRGCPSSAPARHARAFVTFSRACSRRNRRRSVSVCCPRRWPHSRSRPSRSAGIGGRRCRRSTARRASSISWRTSGSGSVSRSSSRRR